MTSQPPGPDGGFFAAPLPAQQPLSYGPPSAFGPPPLTTTPQLANAGPPALVVAAVTSLIISGLMAGWLGLSMLTLISSIQDFAGNDVSNGLGTRGWFLLLNGITNLVLVLPLLRGVEAARWVATAVCGWWVLYWLYQLTRAAQAFSDIGLTPAGLGFGRMTFLISVGLLLLVGWAAVTGALLWVAQSGRHFTRTG